MNCPKLALAHPFLFVLALVGCARPVPAEPTGPVVSEPGLETASVAPVATGAAAVAMPDSYAAVVSEQILRAGGNAVDAAVAVGFVLAVTFPEAGNIGGGGFMLIHMNAEQSFLDYRERAPLAAHRDMYLDDKGEVIPRISLFGHLAVGVPGTVAGLWAAHQRYGSQPWRELVMPAVKLAAEGFVVPEKLGGGMLTKLEKYEGVTNFSEYFGAMKSGQLHRQPELAATLGRIAEGGADEFYSGETAKLLVAEMKRGKGLITMRDLDEYKAVWRKPLRANWRGYEVVSAPLPSSGGLALVQLLKMKEALSEQFQGLAHNSAQYVHLIAEIEKRVFADRAEYLGDPDFVDTDIALLMNDAYISRRAKEINPVAISTDVGHGLGLDKHDTTHFSILDRWGNAVSNTYTLNLGFGSGVVVRGAGFLLNDEMDDFSARPGVPNAYGVVGNTANEIQPGKRMLSSMTPTIILREGEVQMVLGTPGGSTIFTSVFQTVVNVYEFGMSSAQAVAAPRFHHQLLPPDLILFGPSRPLSEPTISELTSRGYRLISPWDFGDMQLIHRAKDGLNAASDPRNRGESRVFE